MFKFINFLLVSAWLSSLSWGQSITPGGSAVQLPTAGGSNDHGMVAINDDGDIYVVWQSKITINGVKEHYIEGAFLEYSCTPQGPQWSVPSASKLISEPDLAVSAGFTDPHCNKPAVESVGTDFIISWIRHDDADPDKQAQLECIYFDGTTYDYQNETEQTGFLIGTPYDSAANGQNTQLARKRLPDVGGSHRQGVAISIHGVNTFIDSANELYDYELQCHELDFSQGSPPTITPLPTPSGTPDGVLVPLVMVDRTPATYSQSGRFPPSLEEDDEGNLVLLHEEYIGAARPGSGGSPEGKIWIRYFEETNGDWSQSDEYALSGSFSSHYQRRPNMATIFGGPANNFRLAWLELDTSGGNGIGHLYSFSLAAGQISATNLGFNGCSGWEIIDARTVFTPSVNAFMGIRKDSTTVDTDLFYWPVSVPACNSLSTPFPPRRPVWAYSALNPSCVTLSSFGVLVYDAKITTNTERMYIQVNP